MLPRQVISHSQLKKEGLSKIEIEKLSASLKLFPTPFKGIYYIPSKEERGGWFIDKSFLILKKSISLFLETKNFYFSCSTAEEYLGLKWRPSSEIHIVNEFLSRKIDLKKRTQRNKNKKTYRAKKIAHLLSFYGDILIFHKTKSIKDAKTKVTPNGTFAMKSQIRKDKKKFRKD